MGSARSRRRGRRRGLPCSRWGRSIGGDGRGLWVPLRNHHHITSGSHIEPSLRLRPPERKGVPTRRAIHPLYVAGLWDSWLLAVGHGLDLQGEITAVPRPARRIRRRAPTISIGVLLRFDIGLFPSNRHIRAGAGQWDKRPVGQPQSEGLRLLWLLRRHFCSLWHPYGSVGTYSFKLSRFAYILTNSTVRNQLKFLKHIAYCVIL